jgi:hypothetical protein
MMAKFTLRRKAVSKILLKPTTPGDRAVFIVEARDAADRRKVDELFETVAELAEVAPVSRGEITAFAVQVRGDNTLFAKIETVLKEEFTFSIVERSFTDVTYHLIQSLCEESESRLCPVPHCDICDQADPFPTRVTMRDEKDRDVIEGHYCSRCAAEQAHPSREQFLVDLLAADRRDFGAIRDARLVPSSVAADPNEVAAYAIAS